MQIKESLNPFQQHRANRNQRIGETHGNRMPVRLVPDFQEPGILAVLAGYLNGPKISSVPDGFDLRDRPAREKIKEPLPIQRRMISQPAGKLGGFFNGLLFLQLAKFRRSHPVTFLERDIESPEALEPPGETAGSNRRG